jgi:hypothetical protein
MLGPVKVPESVATSEPVVYWLVASPVVMARGAVWSAAITVAWAKVAEAVSTAPRTASLLNFIIKILLRLTAGSGF